MENILTKNRAAECGYHRHGRALNKKKASIDCNFGFFYHILFILFTTTCHRNLSILSKTFPEAYNFETRKPKILCNTTPLVCKCLPNYLAFSIITSVTFLILSTSGLVVQSSYIFPYHSIKYVYGLKLCLDYPLNFETSKRNHMKKF